MCIELPEFDPTNRCHTSWRLGRELADALPPKRWEQGEALRKPENGSSLHGSPESWVLLLEEVERTPSETPGPQLKIHEFVVLGAINLMRPRWLSTKRPAV